MNKNRITAETETQTSLEEAVITGTINVRVTDDADPPQPLAEAQVEVNDGTTTVSGVTDADGEVILQIDLSGLAPFTPKMVTVSASQTSFTPGAKTAMAIAIATIDVHLSLVQQ